jgi:hypothetical protein
VGLVLTFFAIFSVSFSGPLVSFRQQDVYEGSGTLLLASGLAEFGPPQPQVERELLAKVPLYAQIANSDAVRRLASEGGRVTGSYRAEPVVDPRQHWRPYLPFIRITGTGHSAAQATAIARSASKALVRYVDASTRRGKPSQRFKLEVVELPQKAVIVGSRNLALPLVAFGLLMAMLALGTAGRWRRAGRS